MDYLLNFLQLRLPNSYLKIVLAQVSKLVTSEPGQRRAFAEKRGLHVIQNLEKLVSTPGITEHIEAIKASYSVELVQYYSNSYEARLVELVQ